MLSLLPQSYWDQYYIGANKIITFFIYYLCSTGHGIQDLDHAKGSTTELNTATSLLKNFSNKKVAGCNGSHL